MSTEVATQPQQTGIKTVSTFLNSESIKSKFSDVLGASANSFIASILAACNQNEMLKKATTESIYTAALMAATLNLPINGNLGFAYLIPYTKNKGKANEITECQFQIGYKGFKQLAQRSGAFLAITEAIVYKGQLISENPLEGFKFDWTVKSDEVIGYVSYFKLLNGFSNTLYMPKEKVLGHASKYSQSFKSNSQWVKDASLWTTAFDEMALKTVTKLNLSKNAPLSVEMQKAIITDQSVIRNNETLDVTYVDNSKEIPTKKTQEEIETERITHMINDCTTLEELQTLEENNPFADVQLFEAKRLTFKS